MLKNNKGFSLIELMVVVAIIAILSMIAVPSYQGFQAKARQKEGFALLNSYYTSAQATQAEMSFFPGNFVATGFSPTGQLGYRVRVADGGRVPPYGSNEPGCRNTNTPYRTGTCTCGGACTNFQNWTERPAGVAGGVIGPIGGCGAPATNAAAGTFTAVAAGIVRSRGQRDCYSINERKQLQMISDGLN